MTSRGLAGLTHPLGPSAVSTLVFSLSSLRSPRLAAGGTSLSDLGKPGSLMSFSPREVFGRLRTKLVTADEARRRAEELVERGIAAERSGSAEQALLCYRTAV